MTSASCRPAPASATRSTWNTWPRPSGPRPRKASRCGRSLEDFTDSETGAPRAGPPPRSPWPIRTPCVGTDSHTTMVNGLSRARLGRRRHRGGGGHAGPADPHAHPRGDRLQDSPASCPKAPPPQTSSSPSPRCCAGRAWSASSSSSIGDALTHMTHGGPGHHLEHGARIRRHLRLLPRHLGIDAEIPDATPAARRSAWRWSRPTPRRRACSTDPRIRRNRYSQTCSNWTFRHSADRRLRDPSARRTGCCCPMPPRRSSEQLAGDFGKAGHEAQPRSGEAGRGPGGVRCRPRRRGDRRHHLLHKYKSNPSVLIAAGLVAQEGAREKGLKVKPWVKTSLAPGSQGRHRLPDQGRPAGRPGCARLQPRRLWVHDLHRQLRVRCRRTSVGRHQRRRPRRLLSVLSGNRNFEGRVNPDVRANYLASPPLVVAYALAGSMLMDLTCEPHRRRARTAKRSYHRRDIWPTNEEIAEIQREASSPRTCSRPATPTCSRATSAGRRIEVWRAGSTYSWQGDSTYVQNPPYFEGMTMTPSPGRRTSRRRRDPGRSSETAITTDHISPGRQHQEDLARRPVPHRITASTWLDFNSYGARRGNHEVMMRGTFANIRIKQPDGARASRAASPSTTRPAKVMPIYDAAMQYESRGAPPGDLRRQGIRHRLLPRLGG